MLKKSLAAIGAILISVIAIARFSSKSPDLEADIRCSGTSFCVFFIKNTGHEPMLITDIIINDRPECTKWRNVKADNRNITSYTDDELHTLWLHRALSPFYWQKNVPLDALEKENITLKVGDTEAWQVLCGIVRARVKTDRGSASFDFR